MQREFDIVADGGPLDAAPPARPARRGMRLAAALAVAVLLMAAGGFGLWRMTSPHTPQATAAVWVTAAPRQVARTVAATGSVRLRTGSTVRIGSQLSGIVRRLNVTVGARVRQGDVIAEIDARPILAKIAQARAQVVRNEVLAAKAQADLRRISPLADQGWVSRQQLEDSSAAAAGAAAVLSASQEDLRAAGVDLAYVQIRAPISGVVASVATQRGETVAAAFTTPTFVTIIQPNALEVVALVDEADIGDVRIGQPADFTVESWPDRSFAGRVTRIAPVATVVSGVVNYEVAIQIEGDMSQLRPDMTANVTITTARRTVVTVPASAVRRSAEGAVVTVRAPSGPGLPQPVRAEAPRRGVVDVTAGLKAGEQVLVQPGAEK